MTDGDLGGNGGRMYPHGHFEALDPFGNVIENDHVPLTP